ncbi:MAG: SLC13 family permease [Blastocatellia bacterium]
MSPAIATLLALLLAIVLSMVSRINVGMVAIALAWLTGVYVAGMKPEAVMAGFPAVLFMTLAGVTLLFGCAEANGTLERLAARAVGLVRGSRAMLPWLFFLIAFVISTVGPAAISAVALVIPLAMVIGLRAGISPFLTALMVANGANAGNLSPVSTLGVIANAKMSEAGIGGHEGKVWFANFIAHLLVTAVAWLFISRQRETPAAISAPADSAPDNTTPALTRPQWLTVVVIALWILGVLLFKLPPGFSAFAAAALLVAFNATDEAAAIRRIPWGVIVMVCGVSVLIALLEKTGGMDYFTGLIARTASARSINGVIAFITGAISTYSSTSGVVLPAFLPTAPKLAAELGADPLAIALSINVGSSIVDVSPLSTLGALCIAAVSDPAAARTLFRQLLFWGLSMTVVGALFCQLFIGWLARL